MSDSLIIIPTYNEKENIEKIIRKVFSLEKTFHILIVDDGSPDGTAAIVKNLQTEFQEQLHIEERTGMINFSIVGRNCSADQRKEYFAWDKKYHERYLICEEINSEYPDFHASVGGEISIDIAPRGNNKSKAWDVLSKEYDHIHFFGDKMTYGGNDYPLALTIELSKTGTTYPVESYKQTWEVLKQL